MRIGFFFLILAVLSIALGVAVWGWGMPWLLPAFAWPAVSFVIVALAYLGAGARVFGKRPDGTLPWVTVVLLLPFFLLTWGIWRLIRLGKEPCWDQVAPGIYLGRRPYLHELPEDVTLVVDMTAEFPRPPVIREESRYRCLPTLDGSVPGESECKVLVDEIVAHAGPVYIHCAQGHGRSAVVAGALLVRRGLASNALEAEAKMKAARPGVSLSSSQRKLLRTLAP